MTPLDQELIANRYLDKCGEVIRKQLTQRVRDRFDALTPDARRAFVSHLIATDRFVWS